MTNIELNLNSQDPQETRDNFKRLQDFVNAMETTQKQLQSCEIFVTSNISGGKIAHSLGGVPLDVVLTRLVAPSAARLTFRFSDFTKDSVIFDVTGLADGETLSARFLVGTFPNTVTVGDVVRASSETQQTRSKF
jgi:hypothetical protein